MDITYEQVKNLCESDERLSVSSLFSKIPGDKKIALQYYRQWMDETAKSQNNLTAQTTFNDEVLVAIKRFTVLVNEQSNSQNKAVEEALFCELASCQQALDKQKSFLSDAELQLKQERENKRLVNESTQNIEQQHQAEIEKISTLYQAEIEKLSTLYQTEMKALGERINSKITLLANTGVATIAEKPSDVILFNLKSRPDFKRLTAGGKFIKLADSLIAQPMSLQLMTTFLDDPQIEQELTAFINELATTGLLNITTANSVQVPKNTADNNTKNETEQKSKLKLFKRIGLSLKM